METTEGETEKCQRCGAGIAFDAASHSMKCGHCGAQAAVLVPEGFVARELSLERGLAASARGGLGPDVLALQCSECGAVVTMRDRTRTGRCLFCASTQIAPCALDPNAIRPESLVPFRTPQREANRRFSSWLKALWFRPNDLQRLAEVQEMRGVYVPFWTFDVVADSQWRAERGDHYYVEERYTQVENGETVTKTRQVQHTRWSSASGQRQDSYDDWLVCAGRGLPEKLVRELSTLDTAGLVPYDPKFLSGWQAEAYSVDLPNAWDVAAEGIRGNQARNCSRDVGGDEQRSLRVETALSGGTFKHVLLPIWICAYRYRQKTFRFLIHGETGQVVGVAPWSYFKIGVLVLVVIGALASLVWYLQARGHERRSYRDIPRHESPAIIRP